MDDFVPVSSIKIDNLQLILDAFPDPLRQLFDWLLLPRFLDTE